MMPIADRAAQFSALLAAITAARKSGDDVAREDAEGALSLLLRGHEIELPRDYKIAQGTPETP